MGITRVDNQGRYGYSYFVSRVGTARANTKIHDGCEEEAMQIAKRKLTELQAKITLQCKGTPRKAGKPRRDPLIKLPVGICIDWCLVADKYYPVIRLNIWALDNRGYITMGRSLLRKGLTKQCKCIRNTLLDNEYAVPSLNDFISEIKAALILTSSDMGFDPSTIHDWELKEYI